MNHYFLVYKPYQVLCQFSPEPGKKTLADFFDVPKDVYPVGRLDFDSEGLLILTNDKSLNHRLLHPANKHEREYWVQVEGAITPQAVQQLQQGVTISIGTAYHTLPCKVSLFTDPPKVYDRNPPIRFRKAIPNSWISMVLHEGKNRQVRKMTAKVGYATLRLIRYRIEKLTLAAMQPGAIVSMKEQEFKKLLFSK